MADWWGFARTNYFRVKDEQAFRNALAPLSVSVHGAGDSRAERPGMVCVLEDDGQGWPSTYYDEDREDWVALDFPALIAEHLVHGQVAVLLCVGAEKLRYLTGHAIAVNSEGQTETADIEEIYDRARRLGDCATRAEY